MATALALHPSTSSTTMSQVHTPPTQSELPSQDERQFAFAQIHNNICLVQVALSALSSLAAVDVSVFRHEFITLFRFSHDTTLHPSDIRILEYVDARATLHEEDNGTVFLARDLVGRLRRWTDSERRTSVGMQSVRRW